MTFYAIVPIVGTMMFLIAGFIILIKAYSGKPDGVATGKKMMTNTAIGIAIILCSWIITTMILNVLANPQLLNNNKPWYQIDCRVGSLKDLTDATIPSVGGTVTPTYSCSNNQCAKDPNGKYTTANCDGVCAPSTGGGGGGDAQCPDSSINICQPSAPHACGSSSCSQYNASISKYASGAATANLLKAIMFTESSCNPSTSNPGGQSYGLMELQVPTAVKNSHGCVADSSVITSSWLTSSANSDAVICIAANYINSLAPTCGNNPANLAANYNGNNACATSQDCTGTICGDSPPKAWECLYDDKAHAVCNADRAGGGLSETRKYVPNILYCLNNPGF